MSQVRSLFSAEGPFAQHIAGYQAREPQIQMSELIATSFKQKSNAIIEAGTGTGKTFAYLVPAILSGDKTLISTASKALQEQLFHRDLPNLLKILGKGRRVCLLKGRANYLCQERLEQHIAHVPTDDLDVMHQLAMVAKFATETTSGDMAECIGIEEDAKVLPYVTSTSDNCMGKECPSYSECYVRKARVNAAESDIIVINHHLFFADAVVKETGFAELIPEVTHYIFDEAHQLPHIASEYFAERASTRMVHELIRDLRVVYRAELFDMVQLGKSLDKLESAVFDLRLAFPADPIRGDWSQVAHQQHIKASIERVINEVTFLYQVLKLALGRTEKLEHLFERTAQIKNRLSTMFEVEKPGYSFWFETTKRHLTFSITPLNVSERFCEIMSANESTWVFTSATLAVNGAIEHFARSLGIAQYSSLLVESPFDYQQQALLCMPRYLPEANANEMAHALVTVGKRMIKAAKGRTFILFTSHRMMNLVASALVDITEYPVFVQGQMSKRILLEKFQRHGNAVLLGTASFWEGVDVRGACLSCVVIDKLPFASPDDPMLQAKIKDCVRQGGEAFYDVQLPQAVIALKQGVGRLIRDVKDRGVLVICDNRLVTKEYGRIFLSSLPNMKRTRDIAIAQSFLESIE